MSVHFAAALLCAICAEAMGIGLWAVGFNRCAARHFIVIGTFGASPPSAAWGYGAWSMRYVRCFGDPEIDSG